MDYDCVVILANEMDENGILNNESRDRLNLGISLFKKYQIKKIITVGWAYRYDLEIPISVVMKNKCIEKGIHNHLIYSEVNSRDTVGDAFFTKINYVEKNLYNNILVVTSDYHSNRTEYIFKFIYGNKFKIKVVKVSTKKNNREKKYLELKSLNAFKNTFKNVNSGDNHKIFKTLKYKHPFYNGEIYPKISLSNLNKK